MSADPWATRIDFARVLADIAYMLGDPLPANPNLRQAVGTRLLAQHLGVDRGTLRGWMDGSEPRHADGERLLLEWSKLTGKARTFAPVDRYVYSAAKVSAPVHRTSDKPRAAAVALHAVCLRWAA